MLETLVRFLQSPEFLAFIAPYAATKLLDSSISRFRQFKNTFKKSSHEWQLIDSLEKRCLKLKKT